MELADDTKLHSSGSFRAELMERVRTGLAGDIRPTFISDYRPRAIRTARLGHGGPGSLEHRLASRHGVAQWTASPAQQAALTRFVELNESVDAARRDAIAIGAANPSPHRELEDARAFALRAETVCKIMPDWPSR